MSDSTPPAAPAPAYAAPPVEPELAHPAARALAFAMDGFGAFALTTIIVFAGLNTGYGAAFSAILLVPLFAALLCTVLTAVWGVTPSKAILGLKVVDADTGRPIGWRSIPRSLVIVAPIGLAWLVAAIAYWIPDLPGESFFTVALGPPILGWIALLVVLSVRPRRRGLQDLAGRSVIIRR
jgi:RDD family.